MIDIPTAPTNFHYFIQEEADALQHAAHLLGGRPWLRRAQAIFTDLQGPRPITKRLCREIIALHELLSLQHVDAGNQPRLNSLDPEAPCLEQISCLATDLWHAFEQSRPADWDTSALHNKEHPYD